MIEAIESRVRELELRISALEARVEVVDTRNKENRELIISMRHELEDVKNIVQLQALKTDEILARVESNGALQMALDRHITTVFDRFEGHLKAIQASVEAGSKPIPFGR